MYNVVYLVLYGDAVQEGIPIDTNVHLPYQQEQVPVNLYVSLAMWVQDINFYNTISVHTDRLINCLLLK